MPGAARHPPSLERPKRHGPWDDTGHLYSGRVESPIARRRYLHNGPRAKRGVAENRQSRYPRIFDVAACDPQPLPHRPSGWRRHGTSSLLATVIALVILLSAATGIALGMLLSVATGPLATSPPEAAKITLDPLPTGRETAAAAELSEHLTKAETRYPGTDPIVRFAVKDRNRARI